MPVISEKHKKENSKQPTTICSLGADKIFRSPLEQFHKSFVAKRAMRTIFSLVGESQRDQRKSFAFMLRHTFSGGAAATNLQYWNRGIANEPAGDASQRCYDSKLLIPARIAKSNHYLDYFGQHLSTDDRKLEPMTTGNQPNGAVIYDEWKSPFNLQSMEDLSWNLNRYKVLPYGISATAIQNQFTSGMQLPIQAAQVFPDGSFKQQDMYTSKFTGANSVKTFSPYLTPMPVLSDVVHAPRESESQMRTVLKAFAPADNAHNTYLGHYKAQISRGTLYTTFVNTCDSKLIVDLVVHSVKNNHAISGEAQRPYADKSVTKHIWDTYARNWKDRTDRNKSDFLIGKQDFQEFDVITDPKTKFLPSSCRLPKYHINKGHQVLEHIDPAHPHHGKIHDHEAPKFVEADRKQMTVMPGKRRTIAINLPAETWDPLKVTYGVDPYVLLNELGYHLSWSVCGAKARTIIEPGQQHAEVGVKVIGQHHAPTTFKVIGRYYETVLPAACINPDNYDMLSLDIEAEYRVDESGDVNVYSASFVDASARDVDGRYVRLHVDGEKRAKETKAALKRKRQKINDTIDERVEQHPAMPSEDTPEGQQATNLAEVTPDDNRNTRRKKQNNFMTNLAQVTETGRAILEHASPFMNALGWGAQKYNEWANRHPFYNNAIQAVIISGGAMATSQPELLPYAGSAFAAALEAAEITLTEEQLAAFQALLRSNPELAETLSGMLNRLPARAIRQIGTISEEEALLLGNEETIAPSYGSLIGNDAAGAGDIMDIDLRRHLDGTQVVYVDHDVDEEGIQEPDAGPSVDLSASGPLDVNVTNAVDVNVTNPVVVSLTAAGLAKLNGLPSDTPPNPLLDSQIAYINQKLTSMVNYRLNLPSTDPNFRNDGPRFDYSGMLSAIPVFANVPGHTTSVVVPNDSSDGISLGSDITGDYGAAAIPNWSDWALVDNFSLTKDTHWSY